MRPRDTDPGLGQRPTPLGAEATRVGGNASALLPAGTLIDGRFTVVGPGVAGGMGVVYPVEDGELGLKLALKVLHPHLVAKPEAVARFRDEASALFTLRHPNIVRVFHFGDWAGQKYLVMEWIDGGSLRDYLRARAAEGRGRRPLPEVVSIVRAVTEAVAHAHERGILHRDLKPENILLDIQGDNGGRTITPHVTDFGIARLADRARALPPATVPRGTAYYMSPEQLGGRAEDIRTDAYSLGVVFYELVCGELPVGIVQLPTERDPTLPPVTDDIVKRSLAADPEQRFASVREFRTALEELERSMGTGSRSVTAHGLLAIVEEIYEGGKGLIPNWTLLQKMKALAERGDVAGMRNYYEACLRNRRGSWIRETLERHGRKTLESERERFFQVAGAAANSSGIGRGINPGKYDPLGRWLDGQSQAEVSLTFADIDRIIGYPLPASARTYPAWWSNEREGTRHVQSLAWTTAGWRAYPELASGQVVFRRASK